MDTSCDVRGWVIRDGRESVPHCVIVDGCPVGECVVVDDPNVGTIGRLLLDDAERAKKDLRPRGQERLLHNQVASVERALADVMAHCLGVRIDRRMVDWSLLMRCWLRRRPVWLHSRHNHIVPATRALRHIRTFHRNLNRKQILVWPRVVLRLAAQQADKIGKSKAGLACEPRDGSDARMVKTRLGRI